MLFMILPRMAANIPASIGPCPDDDDGCCCCCWWCCGGGGGGNMSTSSSMSSENGWFIFCVMTAVSLESSAGSGSCDQKKQFLEGSSENLRMKARLPGICYVCECGLVRRGEGVVKGDQTMTGTYHFKDSFAWYNDNIELRFIFY